VLAGAFASRGSLCAELSPGKGRGVVEIEASPAGGAAVGAGDVLVLVAVLSSGVAAVVISGELPSLLSAPVRKLRLQARCVPLLLPGACRNSHKQTGRRYTGQAAWHMRLVDIFLSWLCTEAANTPPTTPGTPLHPSPRVRALVWVAQGAQPPHCLQAR
jgi:hypothetical protein